MDDQYNAIFSQGDLYNYINDKWYNFNDTGCNFI